MQKYSGMIAHLTAGRQILDRHRRNAKPIHLQCNPVAVAKVFASTINSAVHTMLVLNLKAKSSGGEGGFDA
jgi:hypothetical protein